MIGIDTILFFDFSKFFLPYKDKILNDAWFSVCTYVGLLDDIMKWAFNESHQLSRAMF